MVSIKALAFYLATMTVAVSAAPVAGVDPVTTSDTIIADIESIDAGVLTLAGSLDGMKAKSFDSSAVDIDFTAIHVANQQGVTDAALEDAANSEDSNRVVDTIEDTLSIDIPAVIEVLKAKKEYFEESGQVAVILSWLEVLKSDYETFGGLLVEKTSEDALARAGAAAGAIGDAIDDGIAYYSS